MLEAKIKHGKQLKIINFKKNSGKRKALYIGLKKLKGQIFLLLWIQIQKLEEVRLKILSFL